MANTNKNLPTINKHNNNIDSKRHEQHTFASSKGNKNYMISSGSLAILTTAKEKAGEAVNSAKSWLSRPMSSDWTSSLTQLESLSRVMFSPLAAHPVYKSESMMKALQLMQQQQQRNSSDPSSSSSSTSVISRALIMKPSKDYILQGKTYSWPSSTVLLQAEIPEQQHGPAVSLFQGFASTYPSLAKGSLIRTKKRRRNRKHLQRQHGKIPDRDLPKSLTQIIAEREKRIRDADKISMQKLSTINEIEQITLQINELLKQRKELEGKYARLEEKDLQYQIIIEDLNDAITDIEEGGTGCLETINERKTVKGASLQNRDEEYVDDDGDIDDEDEDEEEEEDVLIDYETGTCFKTLQAHTDDILDLDFNHPRGMLVSSSLDGTVKAWDLYRYRCLGNLEGHKSIVRCLQMEGSHLLTGSDDSTLKFWDLSTIPNSSSDSSVISSSTVSDEAIVTNELFTLEGHRAEITAIDFNDTQIVSGSNDKTIRLWNIETQQCLSSLDVLWTSKGLETSSVINHNYAYAAHDFVGALQFWDFALATGTSDGKLKMWDLRTGQAHRTLSGHNAPITCLQFDEVHIVSGSFDKTIRIWDLRTGSVFDTLTYTSPISNLQFDANKIISCGSTSDTINIYNRTSFQHTQLKEHKSPVSSVRFNNDVLISGANDNLIKLWSISNWMQA